MLIVLGNGLNDPSSKPRRGCLFSFHITYKRSKETQLFTIKLSINSRKTGLFNLGTATYLGEGKL